MGGKKEKHTGVKSTNERFVEGHMDRIVQKRQEEWGDEVDKTKKEI